MNKITPIGVLEAERIAALATMPSTIAGRLINAEERHQLMSEIDAWTAKQRKDAPYERATAFTLLAIRPSDASASGELLSFIREVCGSLGPARDLLLVDAVHEMFSIGETPPHPETLITALRRKKEEEHPKYNFPFNEKQQISWGKALERAREGKTRK